MASPAALHGNKLATSSAFSLSLSSPPGSSQVCCLMLRRKRGLLAIPRAENRKGSSPLLVRSLLESNIGNNGNGASEPARVLLERVFMQTQKLEEQMNSGTHVLEDVGVDLEVLGSDLKGVLTALKKKEEDLLDAERVVLMKHTELNRAKQDLEQREEETAAVLSKQEQLEDELTKANDNLMSQAKEIEDLKLLVEERDREIIAAQSALFCKEAELNTMKYEVSKKNEEAERMYSSLKTRDQNLNEANKVVEKQKETIQELEKLVKEKEHELAESVKLQEEEEEKLKVAEASLEKQTLEWLTSKESLSKLESEALKHMTETKDSLEGLKIVRKLLIDVRSELVSTQKSLASFRDKMDDQERQLERQLGEVDELKHVVGSHTASLKEVQMVVEVERDRLRVEQALSKELEYLLHMDKDLIRNLQEELNKEKYALQQATQERELLEEKLEQKTCEFNEAQNLLQVKESELADARLQIQYIKTEHSHIQHLLRAKDADLQSTTEKLEDANHETAELKLLMKSKEDNLLEANEKLLLRDELVQTMQHELDYMKHRFLEAATVVGRITQLTDNLVADDNGGKCLSELLDYSNVPLGTDNKLNMLLNAPVLDLRSLKQLEIELEMTKANLKDKETEVVAIRKALATKDEELNKTLAQWDARELELKEKMEVEIMEKAEGLKKLYAFAEETAGEKNMTDLATEKLKLEAVGLEVEAATSALRNIADLSRKLLVETQTASSLDALIFEIDNAEATRACSWTSECLRVAQQEVVRLSTLTELLVEEAGVSTTQLTDWGKI